MRFVVVTGLSGAGKSTTLDFLEDRGYYCVDNLPVQLIFEFANLLNENDEIERAALGIDVRTGSGFDELESSLEKISELGITYEILFLESDDSVLVKRYKETRFAAGANRQFMMLIEKTGISWDEFIDIALESMREIADEIGL